MMPSHPTCYVIGKPVKVDPNTVRTVREERARYGHIHNERNET